MRSFIKKRLLLYIRGQSLKTQLVRGALGVGGLKLLYLPLSLATSIVLARGLGPEGFGQYSFVMATISILVLPFGSGLGQLVTRETAQYQYNEEWGLFCGLLERAQQWIILGSTMMTVLIAMVAVRNAAWSINDRWTLLLLASLLLPLLGLNALRSATLRGLRNVFYAQLPEMTARPSLHFIITVGLLAFGMLNPATALGGQIVATGLAFGLGAWFLTRLRPAELAQARPEYSHLAWVRSLLPFTLLAAVSTMNGQIGILALGWLGTNEDIAALKVAMSGAMLVTLSLSIVNMVIGPYIARAQRDHDKLHLKRLSQQSARAALLVGLPIALLLIVFGGPIVELLYGGAYRDTATFPLAILALGQLMNVAFGSVGLFLSMYGFERDTLAGHTIALLVNAVVAVVLIPPFGAVGAAFSIVIALATWNIVLAIRFVKRLGFRPSAF